MAVARIAPAYINDLIDILWRGGTWFGYIDGLPSSLYLALLVSEPVQDIYGYFSYDTAQEVTYTGYARRTIARSLSGFLGTQGTTAASSGTSGTTRPAADQYFPICTTSSQVVTHTALVTHSQRYETGNDVLCYWELPRPMQLSNSSPGFYPCLHSAGLTIRIDD